VTAPVRFNLSFPYISFCNRLVSPGETNFFSVVHSA